MKRERAPQRPQKMMHAAENRHQHWIAGVLPAHDIRVNALDEKGEQAPGQVP